MDDAPLATEAEAAADADGFCFVDLPCRPDTVQSGEHVSCAGGLINIEKRWDTVENANAKDNEKTPGIQYEVGDKTVSCQPSCREINYMSMMNC